MINLFILVILAILIVHQSCAQIDLKNGTILHNGDIFVLTVRNPKQAGYALIPKDIARNFTNQTDFTAFFMDTKVDAGNFFAIISPIIIGNNSRVVGNVTLFPQRIVERLAGGGEGNIINVDFHEQGWYKMNTGKLNLPSDFGSLSSELVDRNATIAQAKYISNTTNSQNRNTTVQVTAIFLPDLVLESENAISIALLFTVYNFPFKFNNSLLSMVNLMSSYINATNTTVQMPVAQFFGFGNSSIEVNDNVNTIKNETKRLANNTIIYYTQQEVESAGKPQNQNQNVNIFEAFWVKRSPFEEAIKNEQQPSGSMKNTPLFWNIFFTLIISFLSTI
jgi:hypothetical protein